MILPVSDSSSRSPRRFATRMLCVAISLLGGFALSPVIVKATPATHPVATIPEAWRTFAAQAGKSLSALLSSNEPDALRLRTEIGNQREAPDKPPPTVPLAIWIGKDGTIVRAECLFYVNPQTETDLRAMLIGRHLPSAPPADMLQPLRLRLRLEPAPATDLPAGAPQSQESVGGNRSI